MTDYLEAILANLRACMHLNAGAPGQHAQQGTGHSRGHSFVKARLTLDLLPYSLLVPSSL